MRGPFAETITKLAFKDPSLLLITADFCYGYLDKLKQERPAQYLNIGSCEQSMVSIAAGLALEEVLPVVYCITPFLLDRALEQVKLDIAVPHLRVMLVGFDHYLGLGPSHNPLGPKEVIALMPSISYNEPKTRVEAADAVMDAYLQSGPSFIRLRNETL